MTNFEKIVLQEPLELQNAKPPISRIRKIDCDICGALYSFHNGYTVARASLHIYIHYNDSDITEYHLPFSGAFKSCTRLIVSSIFASVNSEKEFLFSATINAIPAEPTKPALTEDEQIFVRWAVELSFKYLAREQCGDLWIYENKPIKDAIWSHNEDTNAAKVNTNKYPFSFIQWTDAEPTYLPDLLGDKS